jgi:hypothetical protein
MAISINWGTKVIYVPKVDLTLVSGTDYTLDVSDLWRALKDLEDGEDGIPCPDSHVNYAPIVLGGISLARVVEIINGYTITFEDDHYGVTIINGNTNIADVLNRNSVSVNTQNSAGLVSINDIRLMIHAGVGNVDVSVGDDKVYIYDDDMNLLRTLNITSEGRSKRIAP